jgi:glycosyltransferase involved in cell wall biosynthesis
MKISVITPSFNQLGWLDLAAASVADQILSATQPSNLQIEHIIQDGGTDGMESWRKQFLATRHPHPNYSLMVYQEKDKGMYDAINRGLRRATGEICCYINCDEQYLPGALEKVSQFFVNHPDIDVVFGDAILMDENMRFISYRRMVTPTKMHLRVAPLNILTCSTFFRRSILEKGHFFPIHLKVAGDQLWVYKLLEKKIPVATLAHPLAVFTFTGENLSQSITAAREHETWLHNYMRSAPLYMRQPIILWHRLRKLFAGAYWKRDLQLKIYKKEDLSARQNVSVKNLGFFWPTPR